MSEIKGKNPLEEPPKEPEKTASDEGDIKSREATIEDVRKHFQAKSEKGTWGNTSRPDFVPPTSDIEHHGKFFREVFFTDDIHDLLKTDESEGAYAVKAMRQKDRLISESPSSAWLYLIGLRDRLGYRRHSHEYSIEEFGDSWEKFLKEKEREPTGEEEFVNFTVQHEIDHMKKWSYERWQGDKEKIRLEIIQSLKRLRPERVARQLRKNYTMAQNWFNETLPDSIPEAVFVVEESFDDDASKTQTSKHQPGSDAVAFLKGNVEIYEVQKKIDSVVKMPPSTSGMGIFSMHDPNAWKYTIRDLEQSFDKEKLKNILRQLRIFNERAIELVKKQKRTIDFVGEGNVVITPNGILHILDVDLTTLDGIQIKDTLEALQTGYFSKIAQELERIVNE